MSLSSIFNVHQFSSTLNYILVNSEDAGAMKHKSQLYESTSKPTSQRLRLISYISSKFAAGSIAGSIFTLVISTVGAGTLALPYGVRSFGLIPGIILIVFSAILSYFTLDLLLITVDYLPSNSKISYRALAIHSYGQTLSIFVQIVLMLQFYGTSVSYVVTYSGLIDLVWSVIFPLSGSIFKKTAICIYCILVIPLSLFRSMSKLRFTSFLAFSCIIYLSIVVFIEYFIECNVKDIRSGGNENNNFLPFSTCFWHRGFIKNVFTENNLLGTNSEGEALTFWKGFLTAFPLNIFAFVCHPYMLPIYNELKNKSQKRMRKVMRRAMYVATMIYVVTATFGFLLFVTATCGNILLNNFHQNVGAIIAALGISLSCIFTLPIYGFTFRRSFGELLWAQKDLPTVKHVTVTIMYGILCVIVAVMFSSISFVFGMLGSTTYPILGFILPAIYFCKIVPNDHYTVRRKFAIAQAVFVGAASLASLLYKITEMVYNNLESDCAFVQQLE